MSTRNGLGAFVLLCSLILITGAVSTRAAYAEDDVRCSNGAFVDREARCKFFVHFAPRDSDTKDARILAAFGHNASQIRSIALVVGVSKYSSSFEKGSLPAAHADVERLKTFLVNQQFDEIIVLEDEAATQETISYFLSKYVVTEANAFEGRARVLFAFSGHGVPDGAGSALALSSAQTTSDVRGLYRLRALQGDLQTAAAASWQTLGLIDACYGGDIFGVGFVGGNPNDYHDKGAYVITAGSKGSLTWTIDKGGSVFFQALIDGIENGTANSFPVQVVDPNNPKSLINYGGVVTQGQAFAEATRVILDVQAGVIKAEVNPAALSPPWEGSVMPDSASTGAFFFLANTPTTKAVPIAEIAPKIDPREFSGQGQKTQTQLHSYVVRGIDVSHYSGQVDWQKVAASGIDFAYVKATQGTTLIDPMLQRNLDALHIASLPHGVYLTYDFCQNPDLEVENLLRIVPYGTDMLPIALDLEWFEGSGINTPSSFRMQMKCANADITLTRNNVLRVLQRLTVAYGRAPIIFLPSVSRNLLDTRFDAYPRWTADYSHGSNEAGRPRDLIWTIWQYSDRGVISGVTGPTDVDVFAGDQKAFALFLKGHH
ncbi:GH25 family lysozyme [Tunturiibacter lichenicola]|uniref:GH25 family lysozyme n=1 Tax=Tunturiibacter lichenicola TaxID=2051959 RepID=UPI003D9B5E97